MKKQKVALITGGAKRIGKAITQALHQEGFAVIIHYHHSFDAAEKLAETLNGIRPNSAKTIQANLSTVNHFDEIMDFRDEVLAAFGGVDVLVHNASSFYPSDFCGDFVDLSHHWDDLFLTNAKAPFFLTQIFAGTLAQRQGCIVSLLDIHADGKPFVGYPIYSMAKAAHRMMVQTLALELAPNVRINGVAPGVNIFPDGNSNAELNDNTQQTLTQSVPLSRIGTPDDIAKTVIFLTQADYITGQIIAVDGGRSLTLKGG